MSEDIHKKMRGNRMHVVFADAALLAMFLDRAAIEADLREQYAAFNPTDERIAKDAEELVCRRAAVALMHAEKYLEPACIVALKVACRKPPIVDMAGDFWRRLVLAEAAIREAGRRRARMTFRNELIRDRYGLMTGDWYPGRAAREDGLTTGQKVIERLADDFSMDHAAIEAVIFPKK